MPKLNKYNPNEIYLEYHLRYYYALVDAVRDTDKDVKKIGATLTGIIERFNNLDIMTDPKKQIHNCCVSAKEQIAEIAPNIKNKWKELHLDHNPFHTIFYPIPNIEMEPRAQPDGTNKLVAVLNPLHVCSRYYIAYWMPKEITSQRGTLSSREIQNALKIKSIFPEPYSYLKDQDEPRDAKPQPKDYEWFFFESLDTLVIKTNSYLKFLFDNDLQIDEKK